jgi:hypothetical protein
MAITSEQSVTILDNDAVSLRYHTRTQIVHHELHRFVRGKEFRDVLEKGLEVLQKRGACKWLSDNRKNGALTKADADWSVGVWSPRVMKAGWKYWAVVMPEKVAGQMNMKRWMAMYAERGITARAFTDPDEAMKWLEVQ